MRYLGGKSRIAKDLSGFLNQKLAEREREIFVDLFCGSCNIVANIDDKYKRIANDNHKYLIAM